VAVSYREENGKVVLTMSREDYAVILLALGAYSAQFLARSGELQSILGMMNRLNSGNPHYTPYQVEAKKP